MKYETSFPELLNKLQFYQYFRMSVSIASSYTATENLRWYWQQFHYARFIVEKTPGQLYTYYEQHV
jgi:hypothetical protein